MTRILALLFAVALVSSTVEAQSSNARRLAVIGYYAGRPTAVDSFPLGELTHVIFSFCHLNGNKLWIQNSRDSATLVALVAEKTKHPQLKVIVSLGGWGGCPTTISSGARSGRSGRGDRPAARQVSRRQPE